MAFQAALRILNGPQKGERLNFEEGRDFIIGRKRDCELPVTDGYMSRIHFKIGWQDNAFVIEDMGSSHGTLLNGRKLVGPSVLQDEDLIRAGQTDFVFQVTVTEPAVTPGSKTVFGQPQTTVVPTAPSSRPASSPQLEQQASAKTGPKPAAPSAVPPSDVQISIPSDPSSAIPLAELPPSPPWETSSDPSSLPTDDDWKDKSEAERQDEEALSASEITGSVDPDEENWDSIWDVPAVKPQASASDTNIADPAPPRKNKPPVPDSGTSPKPASPDVPPGPADPKEKDEEDVDWWTSD